MMNSATAWLLAYYHLYLTSMASCSFINLNKYIDIFPPTYFVRVHTDKYLSENLGPSKVPLTILAYNNRVKAWNGSTPWCKFFPVGKNFIGSRTQNTLNLISQNITKCFTRGSKKGVASSMERCFFMDFVHGKVRDYRRVDSSCEVSGGRMHTLIIAELWEYKLFKESPTVFFRKARVEFYLNFVLIFDSVIRNHFTILCVLIKRKSIRSLKCIETLKVSEAILRKISVFRVPWLVAKELDVPETIGSNLTELWEIYSKNPLDEILLIDSLRRANESVTTSGSSSIIIREQQWNGDRVLGQIILLAEEKTKFLSCFSKPVVKFEMYVKPFKVEVWFSILLCCSLIGAFTSFYNLKLKLTENFSPYFFFVSTLFEEPYSVPSVLWNNRVFKTVTISWLLTAMVFTNLYTGLMISDVTSPLQTERLVSFDQVLDTEIMYGKMSHLGSKEVLDYWLNNYTNSGRLGGFNFNLHVNKLKCNVDFDYMGYEPRYTQFQNQEFFAILQKPVEDCGAKGLLPATQKVLLRHPWMYSEFQKLERELVQVRKPTFNKLYKHRAVAFFAPRNRHCPRDPEFGNKDEQTIKFYLAAAVEKELVACNRSILMGEANELKYELSYLIVNYPTKRFYMPEDTFENGGSSPVLWEFLEAGMSKVPHYFRLLIESGIREGITGIRMHKHYLMRRNGTKVIQVAMSSESSVGMSGSIQTIFFILVFLLTNAMLTFTIEVIIKNSSFRKTTCIKALKSEFTKVLTRYEFRSKFAIECKFNSFFNRKLRLIKIKC
jgi:hypothetical protein